METDQVNGTGRRKSCGIVFYFGPIRQLIRSTLVSSLIISRFASEQDQFAISG